MAVSEARHTAMRRLGAPIFLGMLILASGAAWSQAPNPTSANNPFFGSVTAQPRSDQTLKLSLDDAVARGLTNNLGLKEAESDELEVRGEKRDRRRWLGWPCSELALDSLQWPHRDPH